MAIYNFTNTGGNYDIITGGNGKTGILDILGAYVLAPAIQRAAAARAYKDQSRLLEQKAALEQQNALAKLQAENDIKQGYIDMFRGGINANPNQMPGTADFLGGAVGSGANLKDLQEYWLPQYVTVDQGDKKTVAPLWQNGGISDGRSYAMGMSPKDAGALSLALQQEKFNEWKGRQEVAKGWAGIANARASSYKMVPGYTDTNGNPVMADQYGNIRPMAGVKAAQAMDMGKALEGALILSQITKNLNAYQNGGSPYNITFNGLGAGGAGGVSASAGIGAGDGQKNYSETMYPLIEAALRASLAQQGVSIPQPDTTGLPPQPNGGGATPMPAGTQGPKAKKRYITTDSIQEMAKKNNVPVEQVINEAKAQGYMVIQSR